MKELKTITHRRILSYALDGLNVRYEEALKELNQFPDSAFLGKRAEKYEQQMAEIYAEIKHIDFLG